MQIKRCDDKMPHVCLYLLIRRRKKKNCKDNHHESFNSLIYTDSLILNISQLTKKYLKMLITGSDYKMLHFYLLIRRKREL